MVYTASYASPLGGIVLAADELGLTGLWFTGAKYFGAGLPASAAEADTPILAEARRWLEGYFTGQRPAALPPLHPSGSPFRRAVWDILLTIPYGETAYRIAQKPGRPGFCRFSDGFSKKLLGKQNFCLLLT